MPATSSKTEAKAERPDYFAFMANFNSRALPDGFEKYGKILTESAKAIWAKELELAKLEAEQAAKMFLPPRQNGDARHAASAYCSQVHEGTEKIIAEMRSLSDMMRDYSWQLFDLYAENFKKTPE